MPIVFILNGPNLNLLGEREPHIYGHTTLAQIEASCTKFGVDRAMEVVFRQSNHEGVLIDWIHEARGTAAGLIINPAGFVTSSSMAIPEALKAFAKPTIEIHISNTHKREEFRHSSRVSAVVTGIVSGFGSDGYLVALQAMAYLLAKSAL